MPDEHLKDFVADIKTAYQALNQEQDWENLLIVSQKWSERYPKAIQPWVEKWELPAPFFDYPAAIRKVMYTTNTVEGYHR